jgi:hypothetical protein
MAERWVRPTTPPEAFEFSSESKLDHHLPGAHAACGTGCVPDVEGWRSGGRGLPLLKRSSTNCAPTGTGTIAVIATTASAANNRAARREDAADTDHRNSVCIARDVTYQRSKSSCGAARPGSAFARTQGVRTPELDQVRESPSDRFSAGILRCLDLIDGARGFLRACRRTQGYAHAVKTDPGPGGGMWGARTGATCSR